MTRSKGFTLIELLVVVAIISIIAAIGFVTYSGYVEAAKKKTAENAMMQLSLAQTEYYSENSTYYGEHGSGDNCTSTSSTSDEVEAALVEGAELFTDDLGYNVCITEDSDRNFYIIAEEDGGGCKIKLDGKQKLTRNDDC
jgi:prepilin-type N-terminal cleavage/methylation domain-containing protein